MTTNLNEAIATVLCTTMKKWCEDEYKFVKAAGYSIHKEGNGDNAYFRITNEHTNRWVYITAGWRHATLHTNNTRGDIRLKDLAVDHIDFVKMLKTPFNRDYSDFRWASQNGKTLGMIRNEESASRRYSKLTSQQQRIEFCKGQIERAKKDIETCFSKIEAYTEDVQYYTELASEATAKLNALKKELGLA